MNQHLDTTAYIDLHCLEIDDAIPICKQKIYDVAQLSKANNQELILNILTSEEQIYEGINAIWETVKYELQLDHFWISKTNTILVRIDPLTIENPVLKEW